MFGGGRGEGGGGACHSCLNWKQRGGTLCELLKHERVCGDEVAVAVVVGLFTHIRYYSSRFCNQKRPRRDVVVLAPRSAVVHRSVQFPACDERKFISGSPDMEGVAMGTQLSILLICFRVLQFEHG